ncbi:MAG: alanine racemase [Campylobacteraceae bacterium]
MSYILLHKENLHNNLEIIKSKLGSLDKLFAVLKDNAYGHGLLLMAEELSKYGVKRAVVRDVEEALSIKELFLDVLVLSEHPQNITPISNVIFTINSLESLKLIPKNTKVALKVDTGMHRNGISINELDAACKLISASSLNLHSIFTHFRSADEIDANFFWQRDNFENIKVKYNELKHKYSLKDVFFHSCNSAALLRSNHFNDDFARVGIALYGYHTLPASFKEINLKPVLELFAQKISQRELLFNERIGYGGKFRANEDMTSSVYDLGYADGLFRLNGNKELKTTNGSLILGRTSMDSISINSSLDGISVFNNAEVWAKHFDTISYEILVKLSPKIKRSFYKK